MSTHIDRILVVEDDPSAGREVVAALASISHATILRASTIAEATRLVAQRPVQLAIIDLGLPDGSGLSLLVTLMSSAPTPPICVVHTVFDEDEQLFAALGAGAQGYLLKGESTATLRSRLEAAVAGEPAMSPSIARRVLAHFRTALPRHTPPPSTGAADEILTQREIEVLRAISQGYTLAEVGDQLGMSVNTVKTHVRRVYKALQVTSRVAAASKARQLGLLTDEPH